MSASLGRDNLLNGGHSGSRLVPFFLLLRPTFLYNLDLSQILKSTFDRCETDPEVVAKITSFQNNEAVQLSQHPVINQSETCSIDHWGESHPSTGVGGEFTFSQACKTENKRPTMLN